MSEPDKDPLTPHVSRHVRSRPAFEVTFGKAPHQAINAMNAQGDDVPNQSPGRQIAIQRMGVRRTAIPVTILDPFDASRTVQLSCAVDAHVGLQPHRRGIHVSRIGDLLARFSTHGFPSLDHYAAALCEQLRASQGSEHAEVQVSGIFSYVEDVVGVKNKSSIEHLDLRAEARHHGGRLELSSGLGFNHITACPCVQETYKHSFGEKQQGLIGVLAEHAVPFLTHSQRCHSEITLSGLGTPPELPMLLACIDPIIVRCQNTLPREFELLTVHQAHVKPQFLEDALRDLLHGVYELIRSPNPGAAIRIRAVSMESIHDFDITGEVSASVAELGRLSAK